MSDSELEQEFHSNSLLNDLKSENILSSNKCLQNIQEDLDKNILFLESENKKYFYESHNDYINVIKQNIKYDENFQQYKDLNKTIEFLKTKEEKVFEEENEQNTEFNKETLKIDLAYNVYTDSPKQATIVFDVSANKITLEKKKIAKILVLVNM